MGKDLFVDALERIDRLAAMFSLSFDAENKYYSILLNAKGYFEECAVSLDADYRRGVEAYILSLEVPRLQENIGEYLGEEDFDASLSLAALSDNQLMDYLVDVWRGVTMVQNGCLVLGKYGICTWNTGFHRLAKACRGKIVDTLTMDVVSHPFDKFFNVNEVPETKEEIVKETLAGADYVYATDKKDGSTIVVSWCLGSPLITTNGSFSNEQTQWARELFNKQYPTFLPALRYYSGYTFIFELIRPENKIVLDYGDEKALYLLAIRKIGDNRLLPQDVVEKIAGKYGFPVPEVYHALRGCKLSAAQKATDSKFLINSTSILPRLDTAQNEGSFYDFQDLDVLMEIARTAKGTNREGWVIRIGKGSEELMVKLKLEEYFEMHKAFGKITPLWCYKHVMMGDLDDFIGICNEQQKADVFAALDKVREVKDFVKEESITLANAYWEKYGVASREAFLGDRVRMIEIVQEVLRCSSPFKAYAVQYMKDENKFHTTIDLWMKPKKFKGFYKMIMDDRKS